MPKQHFSLTPAASASLRTLRAGPGSGPCSLQPGPAVGSVSSRKGCAATGPPRFPGKFRSAAPPGPGSTHPGAPRPQEVPPPAHVRRPGPTPPPKTVCSGRARGVPHPPKAAPGSCTVTALRLPGLGILTRFQGSGPGSTTAIRRGRGGTGQGGGGRDQ